MSFRGKRAAFRVGAGLIALGLLMPSAPASAGGIFETIFGGFRRPAPPPPSATAFVDPLTSLAKAMNPPPPLQIYRGEGGGGPSVAFCVRTCDGHFFPVRAQQGLSAAEACHSFCPASQTRLYSGGTIDHSVASDGSRYADLANAFVYRKRLVAGCTCNGRDAFGLAHIDPATDPTLRPGDVVATKSGLMAFNGRNKTADFTPVGSYSGFGKGYRDQLSALKVSAPVPAEQQREAASITTASQIDDLRRAELSR